MKTNYVFTNTLSKQFYLLVLLSSFLISSCTVQYVAQYDETVKNEIIRIAGEVDKFFIEQLEMTENERTYHYAKEKYLMIEVDLNSLLTKNEIRALNNQSIKQNELALKLWLDDKEQHKKKDKVSDAIINSHRSQFKRIFIAMAKGEEVKN